MIRTLSESAISFFNYTVKHVTGIMFDREESVIEPGHTSTTHVKR